MRKAIRIADNKGLAHKPNLVDSHHPIVLGMIAAALVVAIYQLIRVVSRG